MKKAVAVPYIIAIVLGIAVIGLIGYFFFSEGGKTTTTGEQAKCQSQRFSYCVQWQASGKDNQPMFDWGSCEEKYKITSADQCKSIGIEIK